MSGVFQKLALGAALLLVLGGSASGQAPVGQTAQSEEDFVGPPDPRLEQPPYLELGPSAPDPSSVVDQTLEALLGRASADYIVPSPTAVGRAAVGFVLVLCLAYLAGHRRVIEIERKLGIAHLATTGLPFVLLGLFAAQPSVGVLSPAVINEINPLLTFGLGWIGLGVGLKFNAPFIAGLPSGSASFLAYSTALPLFGISAVCGLSMVALGADPADPELFRDALILGAAGALTARSAPHLWQGRGFTDGDLARMQTLVQLERIVGIVGLLALASYFRSPSSSVVSWQLPGAAWLFLTVGVGFALGGIVLAALSSSSEPAEALPLFLGGIAFAAGMARYLMLSSLAVCFLVGVLLAAFPGSWKQNVDAWIVSLERPIYFLFLTIVGAVWRPDDWKGWALMAVFAAARLGSKWIGAFLLTRKQAGRREREWLTFAPAGAISLAIVINAQNLFSGARISWIVTAVIVGSLVGELLVQMVLRTPREAE